MAAKGRKKFPDTTFEFFQDCPAADIDAFCRTYTEIINERPTGDMQQTIITTPQSRRIEEENLKKKGVQWYTLISREKNGDISAMTDIMYHPREPHKITQYFTGVSARHRRKGLAKRLKAEMLYLMREKFPQVDYITTTMAPDNRPMQAINAKLGFKLRKTDYVYQWTLTDLEGQVTRLQSAKRRRKRDCQTGSPGDVEVKILKIHDQGRHRDGGVVREPGMGKPLAVDGCGLIALVYQDFFMALIDGSETAFISSDARRKRPVELGKSLRS
ncbi:MAG: GNAT family protein [Desulfobacterales bacterium]